MNNLAPQRASIREVIGHLRTVPNQLTAIRFLAVPVMWVCALLGARTYLALGLVIGLATDLLDGAVARRLHQTSDFGSKFDSLADQLLQLSSICWVLMLMPEIITDNLFASVVALGLYVASLAVGLVRFGRFGNLHLYLSKVGGLFLYGFLIHAFATGQYSSPLFWLAASLFAASSLETILLQVTSQTVDAVAGSLLFRYLRPDHPIRHWLSRLP